MNRDLQALPCCGAPWPDPPGAMLAALLDDTAECPNHHDHAPDGSIVPMSGFLIVEDRHDPGHLTYIQAARQPDGRFVVEHQTGDLAHHYGTETDRDTAVKLISGWCLSEPGWDTEVAWEAVVL